ncbi:MAG TPA: hypothetical protein VFP50_15200 [Anaeromyxobacteraceae bacterium]|nr:hypothetical protein [Anaeromyxobacteraceae bacterium]
MAAKLRMWTVELVSSGGDTVWATVTVVATSCAQAEQAALTWARRDAPGIVWARRDAAGSLVGSVPGALEVGQAVRTPDLGEVVVAEQILAEREAS